VDVHWEFFPTYLENMKRILKKTPPHRTSILLLYNFDDEGSLPLSPSSHEGKVDPSSSSVATGAGSNGSGGHLSSFWSSFVGGSSGSGVSGADATSAGEDGARQVDDLVVDLFPCPNGGHVFIGFSTQQTTGTGFHLAAQLIPTVERENIDFQDLHISNWNCNLLAAAGQVPAGCLLMIVHVMSANNSFIGTLLSVDRSLASTTTIS
jgi:hypothetical protein